MSVFKSNLLIIITLLFYTSAFSQKTDCAFCKIVSGSIQQSQVVYQNEAITAFLAYEPDNSGHLLIVPSRHYQLLTDIPDSITTEMMKAAKYLIRAVKETDIKAEAFQLLLNSGKAAGQHMMHAHLHIIPRYAGEKINTERKRSSEEELKIIAGKIKKGILKIDASEINK